MTEYRDEVEPADRAVEAYARSVDATLPRREIARLTELAREAPIPGRWEGRELQFTSRSGADRWSAVAVVKRRRYVVITGSGEPPARLDLERISL